MHHLFKLHSKKNDEIETLQRGKNEAERIKKLEEEKNTKQENYKEKETEYPTADRVEYSESEINMADTILILGKDNEKKDEELRLLRSLASVGLIISSFAHEVRSLRARLIPRTKYLIRELKLHLNEDELSRTVDKDDNPFYMINLMKEEDTKLKHWLDYSLSTLKVDKRERKNLRQSKWLECTFRYKSESMTSVSPCH